MCLVLYLGFGAGTACLDILCCSFARGNLLLLEGQV